MGLEVVSFTIREVRDKNEYILNMGKPDIALIRKMADIAAAEAERDTAIRRAGTMREASVARAQADQERVIAETASLGASGRGPERPRTEKGRISRDHSASESVGG